MLAEDLRVALDPVQLARRVGVEPDPWQAQALRSSSPRSLWNVTRQGGKSSTAALLAVHQALYVPESLTLLVSASLRQSAELFRLVTGFWRRLEGAPELPEGNKLSLTTQAGARIISLPSSEGTIRGY